jgi:hypothetical protein
MSKGLSGGRVNRNCRQVARNKIRNIPRWATLLGLKEYLCDTHPQSTKLSKTLIPFLSERQDVCSPKSPNP